MRKIMAWVFENISVLLVLIMGLAANAVEPLAVRFEDKTENAGLRFTGLSFGTAAADFDKDGWTDLAISHSCSSISLMKNQTGTDFKDITAEYGLAMTGDVHGLAWLDFDNDTWLDLFICFGAVRGTGAKNNELYINRDGKRFDKVELAPTLADYYGSKRTICPVDLDGDPFIDAVLLNHIREERSFNRVLLNRFSKKESIYGQFPVYDTTEAPQDDFAKINAEGLRCIRYSGKKNIYFVTSTGKIFQQNEMHQFEEITESLGIELNGYENSVTPIDYDSDGDLDLYYIRGYTGPLAIESNSNTLHFAFDQNAHMPFTFDFHVNGSFSYEGRPGLHLKGDPTGPRQSSFEFSADDARIGGVPDIELKDDGSYLYRIQQNVYRFVNNPHQESPFGAAGVFKSKEGEIKLLSTSGPKLLNMEELREKLKNTMYIYQDGKYTAFPNQESILSAPVSSVDAIAADFDNNGAMDLYILSGYSYGNSLNSMLLNDGAGNFIKQSLNLIPDKPAPGVADTAIAFDANNDGREDIFLQNGLYGPWPAVHGQTSYLENQTMSGNWLRIQPIGIESNHWAVGTTVTVTTPLGSVNQQLTGMNNARSASMLPLHFGIGTHLEAEVEIVWPSGKRLNTTLSAGQTHVITESNL